MQSEASLQNQPRPREILLVGGAGYIGSVLARKLLARGYGVRALDDLIYGNGSSLTGLLEDPQFSLIKGDFCQAEVLRQALPGVTDVVLLAALVGDPICKKYPDMARRVNQQGCIHLFDTLTDQPIDHFVFASTCSNYGLRSNDDFATEEAELNPQSLYAETKVVVEQHILAARGQVNLSPTILRFATAYGLSQRMRFDLTVSEFTRTLALGQDLVIYDENTWRPYCHVGDLSNAVIAVLESATAKVGGQVFNVGSQIENYTKKMLADIIVRCVGSSSRVQYSQGGSDPRNYRVSFEKIATTLDFQPQHRVETSVPVLVNALRNGFFDDLEQRKSLYGNYRIATAA